MEALETIEPVRVLHGHTSPETAYLVEDYPYGFRLRCRIRYWVETAPKGAKRGQQRCMSQTTNPKRTPEVWNKAKGSIYGLMTVLYLDSADHVQHTGVSELGVTPEGDALFRLRGIYRQLTAEQRALYNRLVDMSQRSPRQWEEFEAKVTALAEHIADTGTDPTIDNGVWIDPAGRTRYLGTYNVPIYLAEARERIANA
ncbi:hypothetical protein AB0M46_13535 [Dactylosporangium sp. NPDC051485]|uniref:hypothetical protein n=1 Tax=Dactylosporangium sp. NPDC051485 TaxID=3154846 RepID=UPI0034405B84